MANNRPKVVKAVKQMGATYRALNERMNVLDNGNTEVEMSGTSLEDAFEAAGEAAGAINTRLSLAEGDPRDMVAQWLGHQLEGETSLAQAFQYTRWLEHAPMFDASSAISMSSMFLSCTSLVSVPGYDTSNVTNMSSMFNSCTSLVSVPEFDTSKVSSMGSMFSGCTSLVSVPGYDTSNVTSMASMFGGCTSLVSVPGLDMSKVRGTGGMFTNCGSLESVGIYGFTRSVTISPAQLSAEAINTLFENAGTAVSSSQTINVAGNPGSADCDPTIAEAKGWTVTT